MNQIITDILALLALFYILGRSADLAIYNLRAIAEKLGISIFFLGLIMGFFTSFPEMAIGINAIIDNVQNISLGNLFGGIMVLFGLILGLNIYLQRKINAEQNLWQFGLILLFLFIPTILGLNGTFGLIEGLIIVFGYFILLLILYHYQAHKVDMPHLSDHKGLIRHVFLFFFGVIMVLLMANFTIDLTASMLYQLPLSKFVIGILIFAIGTNFPEIIVTIRAWKNNIKELSLSNLLGSAITNILLIGVFSVMRPFHFNVDNSYYILIISMAILLSFVFFFYRSGHNLKRSEGVILILIYLLFVIFQIVFEEPVVA